MVIHASILAWRIPQIEEPGGLQSMGSQSQTRLSNQHNPWAKFQERKFQKHSGSAGGLLCPEGQCPQALGKAWGGEHFSGNFLISCF